MVEYTLRLNLIFGCLSDPTRRDILKRVAEKQLSISQIAKPYKRKLTFAAVSKHLKTLENAGLVKKRRHGKEQLVQLAPAAIKDAEGYLRFYQKLWEDRFDSLDNYLKTIKKNAHEKIH